jgi:hypothetical protein
MNWCPITEYRAEMGRVVVWLSWPQYSNTMRSMSREGEFQLAYRLPLNEGAVWVDAKDCVPIETTGRRVSHFMRPDAPENCSPTVTEHQEKS